MTAPHYYMKTLNILTFGLIIAVVAIANLHSYGQVTNPPPISAIDTKTNSTPVTTAQTNPPPSAATGANTNQPSGTNAPPDNLRKVTLTTNQLDQLQNLIDKYIPDADGRADQIAQKCAGATDQAELDAILKLTFASNDFKTHLHYDKKMTALDAIATKIAIEIFPADFIPVRPEDTLAEIIAKHLKEVPDIDSKKVVQSRKSIADKCVNATSYETLKTNLITEFKKQGWLQYDTRRIALDDAAAKISEEFLFPGTTKLHIKLRDSIDDGTNLWGHVRLWTGAKLSNPYKISGGQLSPSGNSTDAYIEMNLSTRFVERQGDAAHDPVWSWMGAPTPKDNEMHFVCPLAHMPDIDTRIGYLFRDSSSPTNYTASTVAGSSDFYADTLVGFPFWRQCSDGNRPRWKQQMSFDLGLGFSTDKETLQLHPHMFAGLGWQAGYTIAPNRQGYWTVRGGFAAIDQPIMIGGNNVRTNALGAPLFDRGYMPALGVTVTYPIFQAFSLQSGATAYFAHKDEPASWNVTVGVTFEIDDLFKGLAKMGSP
jgi:hypothetical protein